MCVLLDISNTLPKDVFQIIRTQLHRYSLFQPFDGKPRAADRCRMGRRNRNRRRRQLWTTKAGLRPRRVRWKVTLVQSYMAS